jgi:hypothetical protein
MAMAVSGGFLLPQGSVSGTMLRDSQGSNFFLTEASRDWSVGCAGGKSVRAGEKESQLCGFQDIGPMGGDAVQNSICYLHRRGGGRKLYTSF